MLGTLLLSSQSPGGGALVRADSVRSSRYMSGKWGINLLEGTNVPSKHLIPDTWCRFFALCKCVEIDPTLSTLKQAPQSDSGRQSYAHLSETIKREAVASCALNHALPRIMAALAPVRIHLRHSYPLSIDIARDGRFYAPMCCMRLGLECPHHA